MTDDPKKILIYDTGQTFWCYEDEIYDPPEGRPKDKPRENYRGYDEKENE